MFGPGKYDRLCTKAREEAQAVAVLLLVIEGNLGNGFSFQTLEPTLIPVLPTMLRQMADQIERDGANAWEQPPPNGEGL